MKIVTFTKTVDAIDSAVAHAEEMRKYAQRIFSRRGEAEVKKHIDTINETLRGEVMLYDLRDALSESDINDLLQRGEAVEVEVAI